MAEPLPFSLKAEDDATAARLGELILTRGTVRTPFFMPVGTHGAVKTQSPGELSALGAQVVLSNTYHLYLRPGTELLTRVGGLHLFMGWDGPILTDSGGYQVYSLAALRDVDDEGVSFQSHLDGSSHRFTPEKVVDYQRAIGSDFVMPLDECPPGDASRDVWNTAVERTTRWMKRSREQFDATDSRYGHPQYLFCIVQGGTDRELRQQSTEALLGLDPAGCAIGGLAVGEPQDEMLATLETINDLLPKDLPRYLMGVGTPADIVKAVGLGVDMFDCVLPTRNARNGQLFTSRGTMNIRNARFRDDTLPVQEDCDCPLCVQFSRAYLRHLFATEEVLGLRLATAHNLRFYLRMMSNIRQAIGAGSYPAWSANFLADYEGGAA